jgi:transposase
LLHFQGKELRVARKRVGKYPVAFRQMALERMKTCASVSALAEELGVDRTVLYHWQRQKESGHDGTPTSAVRELRKEARDLKRVLAEESLEVDFFKGALQKSRLDARRAATLARRHLRPDPRSDTDARQPEYRAHVSAGAR